MAMNLTELISQRAALDIKIVKAQRVAEMDAEMTTLETQIASLKTQLSSLQAEKVNLLGNAEDEAEEAVASPVASSETPEASSSPRVATVKKTKHSWRAWVLEKGFKNGDLFFVSYKENQATLTGLWENEKYYLCSDLIAPIPEGFSAEAATRHGWGCPIKWDCPTHAAALIKMCYGAPLNTAKGYHGACAVPKDIKYLVGQKMISVYS